MEKKSISKIPTIYGFRSSRPMNNQRLQKIREHQCDLSERLQVISILILKTENSEKESKLLHGKINSTVLVQYLTVMRKEYHY